VIYNVPGRSGVSVAPETIARLAKNANVVGVKEAGGSAERVSDILSLCQIDILSGDDSLTLPMMALGAKGVISVASNIIPGALKKMVDAMAAGDLKAALAIHNAHYRLFKDLFVESNPIPVKAAMAMLGMMDEEYRLPLCPLSDKSREVLKSAMKGCGLLK
jgi:4-hydroxy-tetrahydrodipicolinate synthase